MSDALKKTTRTPELFNPKKPEIVNMMDELATEKIIETIVIEGVEFQIIEKEKTYYAGQYATEPDRDAIEDVYVTDEQILFQSLHESKAIVQNNLTPNQTTVLNIDYTTNERPCAMLRGHETTNPVQGEGIHVIEVEPTLLIKTKLTHAAYALTKKLTGESIDQYHMSKLFGLIKHIFCESENAHFEQAEYDYNGDNGTGNSDAEHYPFRPSHEEKEGVEYYPHVTTNAYVTVPVKRKIDAVKVAKIKNDLGSIIADKPNSPKMLTWSAIEAMQEPAKEFEKMTFAGYDWFVLERHNDKALLLSELLIENREFHAAGGEITWSTCDLRDYLNNEFYFKAFSDQERAKILKTTLPPYINPWYGLSNGKSRFVRLKEKEMRIYDDASQTTEDCIFVLSVEEIVKYFGNSGDLEKRIGYTWPGEGYDCFALGDGFGQFLIDQYENSRKAIDAQGSVKAYWLRTPGYQYHYNVGVGHDGRFFPFTGGSISQKLGVRPAMWVKI